MVLKMRTFFIFLVAVAWLTFLGSFTTLLAHDKVVIAGTGDSRKLLRLLGEEYCLTHPDILIEVPKSVGSSGGIKSLIEGRCDLARVGRPLSANELYYNLKYLLFARAPIVFVVNENIKAVENLSQEALIDIYAGRVTRWDELGQLSGKIYIANREKGDSSRTVIEKVIPAFARIEPFAGKVLYTTQETARVVSFYKNTIAYLPLSEIPEKGVRVLSYAGIFATQATVHSGSYPLVVPLGLVWHGELSPAAADFIAFVSSPAGTKIILASGAYPVSGLER